MLGNWWPVGLGPEAGGNLVHPGDRKAAVARFLGFDAVMQDCYARLLQRASGSFASAHGQYLRPTPALHVRSSSGLLSAFCGDGVLHWPGDPCCAPTRLLDILLTRTAWPATGDISHHQLSTSCNLKSRRTKLYLRVITWSHVGIHVTGCIDAKD